MSDYFNGTGTIGFTCDNCGRELLGCTWVNGMKFCAKCYQETFGNTNPFEKELRDKIADLEAKLAESEDKNKKLKDEVCKSNVGIAHLKNQLKQTKEKLAEKEKDEVVFTIEQLEILKYDIRLDNSDAETGDMPYVVDTNCLFELIDNKINQLKGE